MAGAIVQLTAVTAGPQAVDLDSIEDESEREALRTQIACFGQTPPQLFSAPHPPRRAVLPFLRPLHWGPPSTRSFVRVPLQLVHGASTLRKSLGGNSGSGLALSALCVCGELEQRRVVAVDASSTVHSFKWPPAAGRAPAITSARRLCSTQLPTSDSAKSACCALLNNCDGGRSVVVLSGGHWDGALCVSSEAGRTLCVARQHSRSISCVALAVHGSNATLLTGAADTTVMLWTLAMPTTPKAAPQPMPVHGPLLCHLSCSW